MSTLGYRRLIAWQKAMDLVEMIYQFSAQFPKEELYGLKSQIRRAVVSVPSNIAEGEGRRSKKEFARFLEIANGSLREVETQLLIAQRLNFASKDQVQHILELCDETAKIINGLMKSQTDQH